MGRKSKNHGKAASPQIKVTTPTLKDVAIDFGVLSTYLDKDHVSVSLRYFQRSCECFSKWEKNELKKFSQTIEKLRQFSPKLLIASNLCGLHKNAPDEERFCLPAEISPEQALHEIRVDPSNKLRIHGFFSESVFFLVWLDREHACFKSH